MKNLLLLCLLFSLSALAHAMTPEEMLRGMAQAYQSARTDELENSEPQAMMLTMSLNFELISQSSAAEILSPELDLTHVLALGEFVNSGVMNNPVRGLDLLNRICKLRPASEKSAIKEAVSVKCK